jgi:anti-sigma regulatory factor (Ser/Thr protein kinase)
MVTCTATRRHIVQHRCHPPQPRQGRPPDAVLDLRALLTAPGLARAWTRQVLQEWRLAGLSGTAELIVSELAANATLASRKLGRPFIQLALTLDRGELAILVRDYCPCAPQPRNAADEGENGRGLFLIQAMSSRFGWYPPDDGTLGKILWAALSSCNAAQPAWPAHVLGPVRRAATTQAPLRLPRGIPRPILY